MSPHIYSTVFAKDFRRELERKKHTSIFFNFYSSTSMIYEQKKIENTYNIHRSTRNIDIDRVFSLIIEICVYTF